MSRTRLSVSACAALAFASVIALAAAARGQTAVAPYASSPVAPYAASPVAPYAATQWAGYPTQYGVPPAAGDYRYRVASSQSTPCSSCAPAPADAQPCYPNAESCSPVADCCTTDECASPYVWYGSVGALLFNRDNENHYFFSYDSADEANQLLDSRNAEFGFGSGIEARIARFNCCTCTGCEIVYWGLFPVDDTTYAYAGDVTGNLDPILDFSQIDYNGAAGNNYVNAAMVHRLRRESQIHNVEFNLLQGAPCGDCGCSSWTFCGLVGFRYFRMEEALEFAADTVDTTFTGAADELYYNIDTENDLFGLQFGGTAERQATDRWSVTFGANAGVFANSASADSRIGGSAGVATVNNGPNIGREWRVSAEKNDVAFLGEVRAGLAYRVASSWRLLGEYRVVGVSGVALPTNQIYPDLRGLQDVQLLATNGSLLLHGAFVGLECAY